MPLAPLFRDRLEAGKMLAIGAIASGGVRVLNNPLITELQLSRPLIDQITRREARELKRREELYRQGRPALVVRHRTVLLVDDGLATGASMRAATQALQRQGPKRLVVAVPVAAEKTCEEFRRHVDEIVCAYTPEPFLAVGMWYQDFSQTSDDEVQQLLKAAEQQSIAQHYQVRSPGRPRQTNKGQTLSKAKRF